MGLWDMIGLGGSATAPAQLFEMGLKTLTCVWPASQDLLLRILKALTNVKLLLIYFSDAGHTAANPREERKASDVRVSRVSRYALHTTIRNRVVQGMKTKLSRKEQGIILLQGGEPAHVYSTDAEAVFRCHCA